MIHRMGSCLLSLALLAANSQAGSPPESGFQQYTAALHVHSTFSNGHYEIAELAELASQRNIDVLVLTDSFLSTVIYGVWPLDRIGLEGISKWTRPSVRNRGVANYLAAIRDAQGRFPDVILVPGVEVKPYYYWTGTPWNKLTLHNFNRHLTVSGLSEEDLSDLPVIGNATWNNTTKQRLPALVPALILLVGASLVFSERRRPVRLREYGVVKRRLLRKFAMFSVGLSLFATWNNYPFGRLADPYSGEHDLRPYQRLIDYVVSKDGLVYWSHPEARYHDVEAGGCLTSTTISHGRQLKFPFSRERGCNGMRA